VDLDCSGCSSSGYFVQLGVEDDAFCFAALPIVSMPQGKARLDFSLPNERLEPAAAGQRVADLRRITKLRLKVGAREGSCDPLKGQIRLLGLYIEPGSAQE
jgi:hypothetical protein